MSAWFERPDGTFAQPYASRVWLVKTKAGDGWIEQRGERVADVTAEEMSSARFAWRNLVAAKLHEARAVDKVRASLFDLLASDRRWSAAFDAAVWGGEAA